MGMGKTLSWGIALVIGVSGASGARAQQPPPSGMARVTRSAQGEMVGQLFWRTTHDQDEEITLRTDTGLELPLIATAADGARLAALVGKRIRIAGQFTTNPDGPGRALVVRSFVDLDAQAAADRAAQQRQIDQQRLVQQQRSAQLLQQQQQLALERKKQILAAQQATARLQAQQRERDRLNRLDAEWLKYKQDTEENEREEAMLARRSGRAIQPEYPAYLRPGGLGTSNPYGAGGATTWSCRWGHAHPIPLRFQEVAR